MSAKDSSRRGAGGLPHAQSHARREPEGASADPQVLLDSLPIGTPDYLRVLGAILKLHNPKHSTKHKGVSHKTMLDRQRFRVPPATLLATAYSASVAP